MGRGVVRACAAAVAVLGAGWCCLRPGSTSGSTGISGSQGARPTGLFGVRADARRGRSAVERLRERACSATPDPSRSPGSGCDCGPTVRAGAPVVASPSASSRVVTPCGQPGAAPRWRSCSTRQWPRVAGAESSSPSPSACLLRIDRYGSAGGYSYLGNALPVLALRDSAGWHLDRYTPNGEAYYTTVADFTVRLDHPSDVSDSRDWGQHRQGCRPRADPDDGGRSPRT